MQATIVAFYGPKPHPFRELQNLNFKALRDVEAPMDFDGLIAWLRRSLGRTIANNDCYLRIGMIDDPDALDPAASAHAQNVVRQILAALPPLVLDLDPASVCVAFYETTELPPASTRTFALDHSRLSRALMRRNYSVGSSSHPD